MQEMGVGAQRFLLNRATVRLELLNAASRVVATGTGLLVQTHDKEACLYTVWHLVTGCDFISKTTPDAALTRKKIKIWFSCINDIVVEGKILGTITEAQQRSLVIDLFRENERGGLTPCWIQDATQGNQVTIKDDVFFPAHHEVVRIDLGPCTKDFERVCVPDDLLKNKLPWEGQAVMVVGYPFDRAAGQGGSKSPIWVTRHAASMHGDEHFIFTHLIEPGCFRSMSGSPVIVATAEGIDIIGIYSGILYMEHYSNQPGTTLATLGLFTGWHIIKGGLGSGSRA